jgi:GntR family transcriptional regulator
MGIEPGDKLPSESALAAEFEVSRNTIRELLVQMENEGSILRSHGIGTFLRRAPRKHGTYQSFLTMIADGGRKPTVETMGPLNCIPHVAVIEALSAERSKEIQRVERVIKADGLPVALVIDHLPARLLERIPDWSEFDGDMVAQIGRATGQVRFSQNVAIGLAKCTTEMAEKMGLNTGDPVLHVHTIMQTMGLEPVAVTDSYLRPGELPLEYMGTIRVTPND